MGHEQVEGGAKKADRSSEERRNNGKGGSSARGCNEEARRAPGSAEEAVAGGYGGQAARGGHVVVLLWCRGYRRYRTRCLRSYRSRGLARGADRRTLPGAANAARAVG